MLTPKKGSSSKPKSKVRDEVLPSEEHKSPKRVKKKTKRKASAPMVEQSLENPLTALNDEDTNSRGDEVAQPQVLI